MAENKKLEGSDQRNLPLEGCTASDNLVLPSASFGTELEESYDPVYTVEVESSTCDWMETSKILLAESNKAIYNEVLLSVNEDQLDNEEEEIIEKLKNKAFNTFSRAEKLEIIKSRPTPTLRLHSTHKFKTARHFHKRWYDKFKWLCGNAKKDKMYCWPCLLFSNIKHHKIWSKLGHNNLTNVHTSFRQHENSKSHMIAYMKMMKFNRVKFEFRMNGQQQLYEYSNGNSYNEIVKKNRYIIKCLVDIICSERLETLIQLDNSNNCAELLSEAAKNDCKLRDYLNNTNILVNLSDNMLCDIITSIGKIVLAKIKCELKLTQFCALFIERFEDASENCYLSIICRFINNHSQIQHRFVAFLEVSKFHYTNDLLLAIMNIVNDLECSDKMISIAYDRSLFGREFTSQFENAIRKECKNALLIDFHPPNSVVNVFNTIKNTKSGKLFFTKLAGITAFLLNRTKYDGNLLESVEKFIKNFNTVDWEYPRNVLTMAENKLEILSLLEHINKNADQYLPQTYMDAMGLYACIKQVDFQLLLQFFKTIYFQFDNLMKTLIQDEHIPDIFLYKQRLLNKKEKLYQKLETNLQTEQVKLNKSNIKQLNNSRYNMINEIFDIAIVNLPTTNKIFDKKLLSFASLLDCKYFPTYSCHFPNDSFDLLKNIFKKSLDYVRLKNELMVIYKIKDFYKENLTVLHEYLLYYNLQQVFPEVYKLALLILTIFENNNFIGTINCPLFTIVKNYFEKSTLFNNFTNLPYLMIEKKLVNELWIKELLYNDVMDQLSESDHKICLIYK